MNALGIIKTSASLVASASVGTVVGNVIKSTTPDNVRLIKKVGIGIGAFVLSGMVADIAGQYVEEQIDEGVKLFQVGKRASKAAKATIIVPEGEPQEGSDEPVEHHEGE